MIKKKEVPYKKGVRISDYAILHVRLPGGNTHILYKWPAIIVRSAEYIC